jgi:hypothetical protein
VFHAAATYRQLASFDRRIAEGRERVAQQKLRLLQLEDRRGHREAEGLLSVLQHKLQAMRHRQRQRRWSRLC